MFKIGQLLFTRDGRIVSNGIIAGTDDISHTERLWQVIGENGKSYWMTATEIGNLWHSEDTNHIERFADVGQWRARQCANDSAEQAANLRERLEAIREALGDHYIVTSDEMKAITMLREERDAHLRSKLHVEMTAAADAGTIARLKDANKNLLTGYAALVKRCETLEGLLAIRHSLIIFKQPNTSTNL